MCVRHGDQQASSVSLAVLGVNRMNHYHQYLELSLLSGVTRALLVAKRRSAQQAAAEGPTLCLLISMMRRAFTHGIAAVTAGLAQPRVCYIEVHDNLYRSASRPPVKAYGCDCTASCRGIYNSRCDHHWQRLCVPVRTATLMISHTF